MFNIVSVNDVIHELDVAENIEIDKNKYSLIFIPDYMKQTAL